jgi:hypothetical protein
MDDGSSPAGGCLAVECESALFAAQIIILSAMTTFTAI